MSATGGELRVGIVGSGGVAPFHLSAWRVEEAQVSVHSTDRGLASFCADHGVEPVGSLEQLLDTVDVVDVCTPTITHHDIVLAAAAAGCHVVCEKPLAVTHHEAAAMIAACRAADVELCPGQVVRYFPEYAEAKAAVDAGHIGAPAVLRLSRRGAKPVRGWFGDPHRSGGVIVDQMIHDFDYARWIAGDVESVYAKQVDHGDGLVEAFAILTHRAGALSHVAGGWGPPHTVFETSFTLSGSHGRVAHGSAARPALRWDAPALTGAAGGLLPEIDESQSPFHAELADFAQLFRTGRRPRVEADDSLAALDIALAAVRSVEQCRAVSPEEVAR